MKNAIRIGLLIIFGKRLAAASAQERLVLEIVKDGANWFGLEIVAVAGPVLNVRNIYLVLARLEEKGLVSAVSLPGKFNFKRRMYRITDSGVRMQSTAQSVVVS